MMKKVFHAQIERVVEVYLNREVFAEAWKSSLRLNHDECTFGVRAEKFLGLYVTEWWIGANPDKCKVVTYI